jgi:hypothetical protein
MLLGDDTCQLLRLALAGRPGGRDKTRGDRNHEDQCASTIARETARPGRIPRPSARRRRRHGKRR